MAKTPGDPQPGPSRRRRRILSSPSEIVELPFVGRGALLLNALADLGNSKLRRFERELRRSVGAHRFPAVLKWKPRAPYLAEILLRSRPGEASTDLAIRLLEKIGCKKQAEKLRKGTEMGDTWKKEYDKEEEEGGEEDEDEDEDEEDEEEENPEDFEERFHCTQCPSEDRAIKIRPEMIRDSKWDKIYRLKFTKAGSFRCCVTDLIFDVKAAVTLSYYFDSWSHHFKEEHREKWDIAGPLLNIQVDPEEAVEAVHFPHFLCLEGEGCSELYLAHFVEEGMTLEKPDSVGPNHVMLKNPTFSSWGAILKKLWLKWEKRIHAMVLLYQAHCKVLKLNFYLLPNDASLRQAINRQELENDSKEIQKPGIMKALVIGSHFYLENMTGVTISPEKLKLEYRPPEMQQQYLELFARDMKDELKLSLKDEKNEKEIVWEAFIRKEELKFTVLDPLEDEKDSTDAGACRQTQNTMEDGSSSKISGMHFIERHREELIRRACNVEGVLDILYWKVLDNEQYQKILSRKTSQDKMRELYTLLPSWNHCCKDKLYEALKIKEKHLIDDLEKKWCHR